MFVHAVLEIDAAHQFRVVAVMPTGLVHHAVEDGGAILEVLHPLLQLLELVAVGHDGPSAEVMASLYICIAHRGVDLIKAGVFVQDGWPRCDQPARGRVFDYARRDTDYALSRARRTAWTREAHAVRPGPA
ncbi:hypothetical protein I550_5783 [Mycobacterium intracellulare 1956]|uniref:Uncharacterized protein n=1 Tax=Mycobacterium intracellulare 1956 TaxID=1299331 RepID=X8CCP3_MYCIT|nr:hypothetical protein I550_5783 [Mycobacterium intracellulare 1956]